MYVQHTYNRIYNSKFFTFQYIFVVFLSVDNTDFFLHPEPRPHPHLQERLIALNSDLSSVPLICRYSNLYHSGEIKTTTSFLTNYLVLFENHDRRLRTVDPSQGS